VAGNASEHPATPVWIALGSNVGERRAQLGGAVDELNAHAAIDVIRVSPWIETEPVGGPADQRSFFNGVLEATTGLEPTELLRVLHEVEARFGRDRSAEVRNGPRTLDLDLLFYGDEVIEDDDLIVPHPRLEERVFVLEPLARLDPERRLARSGRTVRERLSMLTDAGEEG
jgi:2-amino-4-hydroxy-6-hydroxymethyldihydropteridine diphosphokinase